MYGQLQEWIRTGRMNQAVMWLENEMLQGRTPEEELLGLVMPSLQESPLLLRAYGERCFRQGRLIEAKSALAKAVKQFTAQTFRRPLLSSMALWVDILLRTGELQPAETLLRFLREEYARTEQEPVEGEVPYALGRAAWLLHGSAEAKALLRAAFDAYIRDGRLEQSADLAIELLLYERKQKDSDSAFKLMVEMHLRQTSAAERKLIPYVQLAEALKLEQREAWGEAASLLLELPALQLPYRLRAEAELALVRALRLSAVDPEFEERHRLYRLQEQFPSDWELQYDIRMALSEGYTSLKGKEAEKREALQEAAAIGSLLQFAYMQPAARNERTEAAVPAPQDLGAPAANARGPWRVHCFGGLRLVGKGVQAEGIPWGRRKAKELFLFLLLQPNYAASKERIIELMLPGDEPERAANHLYVIVHQLKKTLQSALHAENAVMIKDDQVRLNDAMIEYVDVEQYVALNRVAEQLWMQDQDLSVELYAQAGGLYGELLPELPYLDWLEEQREVLLEKQTVLLGKLGKAAEMSGATDQAERHYREWIELRPYQEEAYQAMMKLLMRSGRKKEAERWYGKLTELCLQELGTVPSEETRTILSG
ncbi:hypothetical protein SD70_11395 [Gordoniibacillus kamchatkensis]|uniref:Bacterial transcriptional activator domain-containing protein n=1 Tax=Gordoniibacillus kamchatkensis TaxID=1590651 RepID=A0ABR5AIH2_9BACL|nr:BTAD domain-containing putative transcriptional regulator [Paenibacillus sp. VKM B-2647]KIL40824.1 hypothetical protein SD70_11395 [Paenibacillus sp. VKM B-2647]